MHHSVLLLNMNNAPQCTAVNGRRHCCVGDSKKPKPEKTEAEQGACYHLHTGTLLTFTVCVC